MRRTASSGPDGLPHVAGSFTLDGRSAPWVEGVIGDHTNVVGLSLPLLRDLLGRLEVSIVDLWDAP